MTYRARCAGRVWHRARKNARWVRLNRGAFTWATDAHLVVWEGPTWPLDAYGDLSDYLDTLNRRMVEAVLPAGLVDSVENSSAAAMRNLSYGLSPTRPGPSGHHPR